MRVLLFLCAAAAAYGQPGFTVASVKPDVGRDGPRKLPTFDPGRITFTNLPLKNLISRAYGVPYDLVSGPDWMSSAWFTIEATMPPETSRATADEMLQNLLVERFQIRLRRDRKEMPVYALTIGKNGPKLKNSADGTESIEIGRMGSVRAAHITMARFADLLNDFLGRPVIDQTALRGSYDIVLDFSPEPALGAGMAKVSAAAEAHGQEAAGGSIFTAVQAQLGLKLEARRAAVETIVIESAVRTPIEN
jgi:uncharacterized protein (TIGR03435 family)